MYRSKQRSAEYPNIFDGQDLENIEPSRCGRVLRLENFSGSSIEKLFKIIGNAYLEVIHLFACFCDSGHTEEVLRNILENSQLKKIDLSLRQNAYNEECIRILEELIRERKIKSLEFPEEVKEQDTEKLLQAILERKSDMRFLNLGRCELSPKSVSLLKKIVKNDKVSGKLDLSACTGIGLQADEIKATLTSQDRKVIDAQSFWKINKLQIVWFKEIPKLEVNKLNTGRFKMFQAIDRQDFDGLTGEILTTSRFLIGKAGSKAIQFFRGETRKRKSETKECGKKKRKMDSLCDLMASTSVGKRLSEAQASTDHRRAKELCALESTSSKAVSTNLFNCNVTIMNKNTAVEANEGTSITGGISLGPVNCGRKCHQASDPQCKSLPAEADEEFYDFNDNETY